MHRLNNRKPFLFHLILNECQKNLLPSSVKAERRVVEGVIQPLDIVQRRQIFETVTIVSMIDADVVDHGTAMNGLGRILHAS